MGLKPNHSVFESENAIMSNAKSSWSKWPMISLTLAALAAFGTSMSAQSAQPIQVGNTQITGLPDDWTHHHVVFSDPGTERDAILNGKHDEWQRIVNDPRYVMQQLKRHAPAEGPTGDAVAWMNSLARARANSVAQETDPHDWRNPILPRGERIGGPKIHSDWSMDLGGTATIGADQYPAKYSFSTTTAGACASSSTPDYVVYNTGQTGSNTGTKEANIIAYDNIYTGCSGTVPTVYWSYYTGTGRAATSATLSADGTKVAFLETGAPSGSSTLRILKWKASEGTDRNAPVPPTHLYTNTTAGSGTNTAWSTCPAGSSCLISIAFQADGNTDTISDPYYDYTSDTLWVGDSGGYLHEFTGVFLGTPGEVTTGGWPVNRSSCSGALASPVYDGAHTTIFVGDFCGELDRITTAGAVTSSGAVGFGSPDIDKAPLVDPAAGKVYLFVSSDTNGYSAVFQFAYNFTSGSGGTEATVGDGNESSTPIYAGTFDNQYFTSTSSSPTGHLWVCGDTGGHPELYPVPINSDTMTPGAITAATTVSGSTTTCSPVTEFCTNSGAACTSSTGTDYLFVSPQTEPGTPTVTGCTGSEGCVISYKVSGATVTLSGAGGFAGGAGGMIVDTQNSTTSGALQIYFGTLGHTGTCAGVSGTGNGTGGCAIQAPLASP